jgi:glutamate-1-semialdehyde 2,1-aminomutase
MGRYTLSEIHLKRAEQSIPVGSQTFSKSKTQYPVGISPLFASKGKGAYLWDLDNNKYIDLVSGLASITLGYGDRNLEKEIKKQLKKGVIFSLPGALESEVAEQIINLVPSAEMVRFGKNGSDATAAAIRLARAYTGRDHIIVCGYHGWQDWYIGNTTRNLGVPKTVSDLTHRFEYNNLSQLQDTFDKFQNQVAAVIMEPMNKDFPVEGFLQSVKELTHKNGAVLIFDEIITGFRFSEGGAQELFNVTPDLSTFGKGMASGFPISAVVGNKEIMSKMEDIFFSGTFGGELLSLAASKYVLSKHQEEEIIPNLEENGTRLAEIAQKEIDINDLRSVVNLSGHSTWKFLNFNATLNYSADEIKTYFLQEVFSNGLLTTGTHNVTLAHNQRIAKKLEVIYQKVFGRISESLKNETLRDDLKVLPLVPLFKVR